MAGELTIRGRRPLTHAAVSAPQVIIAESYGGRDEPVDTLVASLVNINVVPLLDPLRVKATPTESTYQARVHAVPV